MANDKPKLILFPVPLGDTKPSDVLPQPNFSMLKGVRHFVVENLRSARRFIKACDPTFDIDACTFAELNRHTDPKAVSAMLAPLRQGHDMGVISEAGCPAVADPGADVVAIAQREGYQVVPLVGPSSILMSLMASGFNGQSFAFAGYLPIDSAQRLAAAKQMERRIRSERQTQIFIETPYRNNKLLQWLTQNLSPELLLCVASDITGPKQSITTLSLAQWRKCQYDYDKIPTIFLLYL